ncbi:hypothetical protein OSTOST_25317 [Ostertagia ostertagi]
MRCVEELRQAQALWSRADAFWDSHSAHGLHECTSRSSILSQSHASAEPHSSCCVIQGACTVAHRT